MEALAGKVIVITGASSGIGKALALELAQQKPRLVLAARNRERLEEVAALCQGRGAEALVVPTDVTSAEACRRLIEETIARFQSLDVLVNNAGAAMWARFDELANASRLEELMQLNYMGSVYPTHSALTHLKQSRGLIVAIASISGLISPPLLSGYAASKHAVMGFFESLRIELKASGVGVTIVAPDFVQSEILAKATGADGTSLGDSPLEQRSLLSAEKCAKKIVRGIERRKRLVLTSERSAWARWGQILAPKLVDRISAKIVGFRE
ncbi:MAG: SDR family oxidoreductase [Planctomycetota bacterium]|nr:SDR family oxidoreductase [Planctomycetota bacterium]